METVTAKGWSHDGHKPCGLAALAADSGDLQLICPSDHHIPDGAAFAELVHRAKPAAAEGALVTFGVIPSFPSTAYGYIEQGEARPDGSWAAARFLEKPAAQLAQQLLLAGNVVWNAGIFFCRADVMLQALDEHCPATLAACKSAMAVAEHDGVFIRPAAQLFKKNLTRPASRHTATFAQLSDDPIDRFFGTELVGPQSQLGRLRRFIARIRM